MTTVLRHYLDGARNARAIAHAIERAIAEGALEPGESLPPIRALASELGVNPATTANAYRQLQTRGLTFADRRRGTRVTGVMKTLGTPAHDASGLVDLSTGNVDPDLLPDLSPALAGSHQRHVGYGAHAVLPQLARIASRGLNADGISAPAIAVVSGAMDGIERVLAAHLGPGDAIAVEDPCFSRSLDLVRALNLRPIPVACDDDGPKATFLQQAMERGSRAFLLTPRAQNPFGSAISPTRHQELLEVLVAHPETLLIEDDHAFLVTDAPSLTLSTNWGGPWAVVRSYAKALGPDLRVALIAGDETTIDRVSRRQRAGAGWVSHILQTAVATVLEQPQTAPLLARACQTYNERRTYLLEGLRDAGVRAHGKTGFNVWVPVSREVESVLALRSSGYAVLAGERFRIDSNPAIRVTTATLTTELASDLISALSKLAAPAHAVSVT